MASLSTLNAAPSLGSSPCWVDRVGPSEGSNEFEFKGKLCARAPLPVALAIPLPLAPMRAPSWHVRRKCDAALSSLGSLEKSQLHLSASPIGRLSWTGRHALLPDYLWSTMTCEPRAAAHGATAGREIGRETGSG